MAVVVFADVLLRVLVVCLVVCVRVLWVRLLLGRVVVVHKRVGVEQLVVAPARPEELLAEERVCQAVQRVDQQLVCEQPVDDAVVQHVVVLSQVALLHARVHNVVRLLLPRCRRCCCANRRCCWWWHRCSAGRRHLDHKRNDDLARLARRQPENERAWRRACQDVLGLLACVEACEELW